jgi:hypothetical protein
VSGLIDPQRNLLTTLLVGSIGVLVLVGLILLVLVGRVDLDRIDPIGDTGIGDSQVDVPDTGLANFNEYSAITERPVFFSDRRLPVVEMVEVDDGVDAPEDPIEEESIEDLKAMVAGIIITPEMRLAMVRDEAANKTVTLREGMSLEGEQAAWRLDAISPRSVSFVSVDGRQSELELKVNTTGLQAGSPGQVRTPASRREAAAEADEGVAAQRERAEVDQPTTGAEADARARAEEVRRRVAERRAELRAEAERRAQLQRQRQDN